VEDFRRRGGDHSSWKEIKNFMAYESIEIYVRMMEGALGLQGN